MNFPYLFFTSQVIITETELADVVTFRVKLQKLFPLLVNMAPLHEHVAPVFNEPFDYCVVVIFWL